MMEASVIINAKTMAAITNAGSGSSNALVPINSVEADELHAGEVSDGILGAEGKKLCLWLTQSKVSVTEIVLPKFVTKIEMVDERKLVDYCSSEYVYQVC